MSDQQTSEGTAAGYCPQCGSPHVAGAAFCSNCGTNLRSAVDSADVGSMPPPTESTTQAAATPSAPPPSSYPPPGGYPPPPAGHPPSGYPPPYPPHGGYGYAYPAPVQQRTNGFAIAGLVLGIVWIYWIGSVLALVFGYVAKSQIDQSNGTQGGRGMAIAAIVLGWIGVATLILVIVLAAAGAASSPTP
jgi:Domain of unknown function (DUF4190)/zinc-ribbon domain